jgi:acetylglutamate kinase
MVKKKSDELYVFKYGGNAMVNDELKDRILKAICARYEQGNRVLIVHGGGPFIQRALDRAQIASEFIDGQRKTSPAAMKEVETALKGEVNSELVGRINAMGYKAVGLSGKDGQTVVGEKRRHEQLLENGERREIDLGRVGNVLRVEPDLLNSLLDMGYIPVMTCIAQDESGESLNINGDIFAGHIAGHLNAQAFVVLTDIDGLLRDVKDPKSLLAHIALNDIEVLVTDGVIQGGMIPKMEACENAIRLGAKSAYIINGTKPEQLARLAAGEQIGTKITYGTEDK